MAVPSSGITGAVVFFVGIGVGGVTGSRLAGDFIYLLAAACWAAYSIASKQVLSGMEPLRATTYATGVGALALVLISIPALPGTDWSSIHASTWANVVFLAIGPTAIAYLFYYRGLRSVSPVTATITMFSVPVFGTISSVLFLDESFTMLQLVGALITIAGALLAVLQRPAGRSGTRSVPVLHNAAPLVESGHAGFQACTRRGVAGDRGSDGERHHGPGPG